MWNECKGWKRVGSLVERRRAEAARARCELGERDGEHPGSTQGFLYVERVETLCRLDAEVTTSRRVRDTCKSRSRQAYWLGSRPVADRNRVLLEVQASISAETLKLSEGLIRTR